MSESKELKELRQLIGLFNNSVLTLKFRFAIWESMNNKELLDAQNKNGTANVYEYIRNSLLVCCFLDIANLGKDVDRNFKLLSLVEIKKHLNNPDVTNELLAKLQNKQVNINFLGDKPSKEYVEEMHLQKQKEFIDFFNFSLKALVTKLKDSDFNHKLNAFWDIRSKIAAHQELSVVNGQLSFFDISKYGLKWEDISLLIRDLGEATRLLFAVVENSDLASDSFENEMKLSIIDFWKPFH